LLYQAIDKLHTWKRPKDLSQKIMLKLITVNRILWAVYLSLLGVLLPHTAWTAAFAFEASIAVLIHKLSGHIDRTPRRLSVSLLGLQYTSNPRA
jgi:hypothetical protein